MLSAISLATIVQNSSSQESFKLFSLFPIDWNGIGAMVTLLAVGFAYYQHWSHQNREKERGKREILEEIIQPLEADLKDIAAEVPYGSIGQFRWKQMKSQDRYLISQMDYVVGGSLGSKIEEFDNNYEYFTDHFRELLNALDDLFRKAVNEFLFKYEGPDYTRALNNIKGNSSIRHLSIAKWKKIEGIGPTSVSYFPLIFYKTTPREYVGMLGEKSVDQSETLYNITYNFDCVEFDEPCINNVLDSVRRGIAADTQLTEYLKTAREIHHKAKYLKEKLEVI